MIAGLQHYELTVHQIILVGPFTLKPFRTRPRRKEKLTEIITMAPL